MLAVGTAAKQWTWRRPFQTKHENPGTMNNEEYVRPEGLEGEGQSERQGKDQVGIEKQEG